MAYVGPVRVFWSLDGRFGTTEMPSDTLQPGVLIAQRFSTGILDDGGCSVLCRASFRHQGRILKPFGQWPFTGPDFNIQIVWRMMSCHQGCKALLKREEILANCLNFGQRIGFGASGEVF